ncbi:exgD, partial [Ophiophagus hannah]
MVSRAACIPQSVMLSNHGANCHLLENSWFPQETILCWLQSPHQTISPHPIPSSHCGNTEASKMTSAGFRVKLPASRCCHVTYHDVFSLHGAGAGMTIRPVGRHSAGAPQPFEHQGLVLWRQVFPQTRGGMILSAACILWMELLLFMRFLILVSSRVCTAQFLACHGPVTVHREKERSEEGRKEGRKEGRREGEKEGEKERRREGKERRREGEKEGREGEKEGRRKGRRKGRKEGEKGKKRRWSSLQCHGASPDALAGWQRLMEATGLRRDWIQSARLIKGGSFGLPDTDTWSSAGPADSRTGAVACASRQQGSDIGAYLRGRNYHNLPEVVERHGGSAIPRCPACRTSRGGEFSRELKPEVFCAIHSLFISPLSRGRPVFNVTFYVFSEERCDKHSMIAKECATYGFRSHRKAVVSSPLLKQ